MAYDPDEDDYDDYDDPGSPANKKLKPTPVSKKGTEQVTYSAVKSKSNKIIVSQKESMSNAVGDKEKQNTSRQDAKDDTSANELGGNGGKEEDEEAEDEEEDEGLDMNLAKSAMNADKMVELLAQFTPDQMTRYEAYRRASFLRANMKRLVQSIAGTVVPPNLAIVFSGIAKIFVGELTETGRVVMEERGDVGPIRPSHIREAYRRLKETGKVPLRRKPPLFH